MNKNDLRFQKTETAIKEAYRLLKQKDTSFVKVKDLCEKAGINKTTFYCHYSSVEELHKQVCRDLVERMMENCYALTAKQCTLRELIYSLVTVFKANREAVQEIYGTEINNLVDDIENYLMRYLITPDMDDDKKMAVRFCIGGGYRLLIYEINEKQLEKTIEFVECVLLNKKELPLI